MLKAIIFDMDDTLLKLHVDWRSLTEDIDVDYFNGNYPYLTPHKFFVAYFDRLLNLLTKEKQLEIRKRRIDAESEGVANEVCFPYNGVISDLSKTYRLGVVSGNYRSTVQSALSKCGLRKYIKVIVSIDDCPVSKPSPAPLFLALRTLRIKPKDAVYVGDHPDDIRAGKNAGMKTIGIASSDFAFNRLRPIGPDVIVKNVGELPKVLGAVSKR